MVLDYKSECGSSPLALSDYSNGSFADGCWYPRTFGRAVIIIIDALRYDFTVPYHNTDSQYFHNALRVPYEISVQSPLNSFLLPFIADPPTTTLQRIKGLTTGTLPTFVDAGSNFAGTAIEEDNLLLQLQNAGKKIVHLGDDTWHALFPGYFDSNLTRAYDSFNVWDLHTVDNGVTEHILPLITSAGQQQWDIIIGHYLGVDHVGHQYGPNHPVMQLKLNQMDNVLRKIVTLLDQETLLVVMGDHGMDAKGDHGGESDDEVEAALWMYSKKEMFGREHANFYKPPKSAKERAVRQIDLVPTLSILLGMPIPFNNLGAPITEVFAGSQIPDWQKLEAVYALTASQIQRYQVEYSKARNLGESLFAIPTALWHDARQRFVESDYSNLDLDLHRTGFLAFSAYQKETLQIFRSLWAIFDIASMLQGIGILVFTVLILAFYTRDVSSSRIKMIAMYARQIGLSSAVGICFGYLFSSKSGANLLQGLLLGFAGGGIIACMIIVVFRIRDFFPRKISIWGWLSSIFTVAQAIGFASNSYTIWEDEILLFFLGTFASFGLLSSIRQKSSTRMILGITQSIIFLFLTRFASLSRLCREEQMPVCRSTFYASTTSSTSAPWQAAIPLMLSFLLPSFIKSYYRWTQSYEGSAVFWIGIAFRIGLLGSAFYWILDASENNGWLGFNINTLKTLKISIAQIVLAIAFAAGTTTFALAKPCVRIEMKSTFEDKNSESKSPSLTVFGYSNVHGSRYFILITNFALGIILLQKPMGGGALGILVLQILALLEIINANDISKTSIGPIILGLLGNFYFFKTGHQATLSAIQWESAFIPFTSIIYPWSPIIVILNTFGAQILATAAVPLTILWKQPPKRRDLLEDVGRAVSTNILYYAVINLATTMWAAWLRRHLMLYRIFSPRFMTGAVVLIIVDIVGIFIALIGVRWNSISVAEVFGWP